MLSLQNELMSQAEAILEERIKVGDERLGTNILKTFWPQLMALYLPLPITEIFYLIRGT